MAANAYFFRFKTGKASKVLPETGSLAVSLASVLLGTDPIPGPRFLSDGIMMWTRGRNPSVLSELEHLWHIRSDSLEVWNSFMSIHQPVIFPNIKREAGNIGGGVMYLPKPLESRDYL